MTDTNRALLVAVVDEIGDLRDEVVFCGGAIAGLLITNPAGDPIRETDDVDCIVEIGSSVLSYRQIETRLYALGWQPGSMTVEGDPLCRFRKKGLVFDVMPTQREILGFAAEWAREALKHSVSHVLENGSVKIVAAPYFLAMKLEAFNGRGKNDYYGSHDLEDLVTVVEGRREIVDDVRGATASLRRFLSEQLAKKWERLVSESIPAAMRGDPSRCRVVEQRVSAIRDLPTPT